MHRILGFKALALFVFYLFCLAGLICVQDDAQSVTNIISSVTIITGTALAVRGYQETRK